MKNKLFSILLISILSSLIFADTSLEEALYRSKTMSVDMKLKIIERDINNKAILTSLPSVLPSLAFTISADSTQISGWDYSQYLSINQTIFNLPVFLTILKNKEYSDIANLLYLKGINDISQSTIESYFNLLSFQLKLSLDSSILILEENNLKKNRILYQNGMISESDILLIESNYYSLISEYEKDKLTYENYLEQFINLTGIEEPGNLADIDTFPVFTLDDLEPEKILSNLPEYLIAKKNHIIATHEKIISYSEFLPKASLTLSSGLTDSIFEFNPEQILNGSNIRTGISISFPIFTGFSRSINILEKSYLKKSAELTFLKTKQNLILEIKNFDDRLKMVKNYIEGSKKLYESSNKNFQKAKILLENNSLSLQDYINIEKSYKESFVNYLTAKKEYYKTYYRYLYLIRRIK